MLGFIMGTGRCGTVSIANLLDRQPNTIARHERILLPWKVNIDKVKHLVNNVKNFKAKNHFEVTSSYLTSVPLIYKLNPDVKFVCLKRDRQKVIDSFFKKVKNKHHWTCHNAPGIERAGGWDDIFPTYDTPSDPIIDKKKAIGMYWDEYYQIAEQYEKEFPFKIFETEHVLNEKEGQEELFNFLEIDPNIVILNIKKNSVFI